MSERVTIPPNTDPKPFALGDKVRVTSSWLDRKGQIYTVEAVTDTALRVSNENATLTYRKDKFTHA